MFQPTAEEKRDWKPILIGAAAVLFVVVALVLFLQRRDSSDAPPADPNAPSPAAPHAANLALANVKMSTADIGTGGQLYYVTGTITNNSDKPNHGATVELLFRDDLGQACQRDREPIRVIIATEPALDTADLSHAPLAPHQSRDFQIPIEHISSRWNGQYPTLTIVKVAD